MEKMEIFNQVAVCPPEALRSIESGRLKGKSDINPMWRFKVMTQVFGPCGFGWRYEITKQWIEQAGNESKAFCNINLYVKVGDEWSEAIPGTGGSSFVTMEKNGPYVSDECHKMALTDALSVSMKALGVASSVYFAKDADFGSKYSDRSEQGTSSRNANVDNINTACADLEKAGSKDELLQAWNRHPIFASDEQFRNKYLEILKKLK